VLYAPASLVSARARTHTRTHTPVFPILRTRYLHGTPKSKYRNTYHGLYNTTTVIIWLIIQSDLVAQLAGSAESWVCESFGRAMSDIVPTPRGT